MLQPGDEAPFDLELSDQDGQLVKLADFKGQKIVVYFYPKDNTPGCTTEAKNFRDSIAQFDSAGVKIFGVSADSVESHKKFATKHKLPFTLLSDPKMQAAKAFGAEGKRWAKRMTWLIDEDGIIEKNYEKVSSSKHNAEVCEFYLAKK